uniref:Uncharacterized protein n=1 Tax=Arundo donax TaxID=35708 RepID=A0A0A9GTX2_ARUDO
MICSTDHFSDLFHPESMLLSILDRFHLVCH